MRVTQVWCIPITPRWLTDLQNFTLIPIHLRMPKSCRVERANIFQLHIPTFDSAVVCTYKFLKRVYEDDTAYNLSTDRCGEKRRPKLEVSYMVIATEWAGEARDSPLFTFSNGFIMRPTQLARVGWPRLFRITLLFACGGEILASHQSDKWGW